MTIGIDLGNRYSHCCVLDAGGTAIDEGRLSTSPAAFRVRGVPRARIALEVGTRSPWVSELLKEAGHQVLVANARKLRMIFDGDSKNGRLDAQQLARVARMDPTLLYAIEHRGRAGTHGPLAAASARQPRTHARRGRQRLQPDEHGHEPSCSTAR
ncbi:MAG: transposase [Planctomycetes bacterium]|nr:transposase [Planctomycetota bacterium]